MVSMRGAYLLISVARRGQGLGHLRQNVHPGDAGLFNRLGHQRVRQCPCSLRSSWKPVMPFSVPAILQSMSQ